MVFGQKGDKCGQEGVEGNLVDLGVYTPPRCSQKGGFFCLLFRRGLVSARHGLRVSYQRVDIESLDRLGQARARSAGVFSLYPQMTEKPGGIPPFEHFL